MNKNLLVIGPRTVALCIVGGLTLGCLVDALMATTPLASGATIAIRLCLIALLACVDTVVVLFIITKFREKLLFEYDDKVRTCMQFAHRFVLAIEMRDPSTPGHNDRLGRYCRILAEEMKMEPEFCEHITYAAPFHDVGKIGVPDAILNKPGPLTDAERDVMERHVEMGALILESSNDPIIQMAHAIVSTHHEAFDGTGYPRGLAGEEIPIEGRIAAVADVFDALLSSRPYKDPWPVGKVIEEIQRLKGTRFDPQVVEAMHRCVHRLITVARESSAPAWQVRYETKRTEPISLVRPMSKL